MPAIQHEKTIMLRIKNKIGIKIILRLDPTKSEVASRTASDIYKLFLKHRIAITYNNATSQTPPAANFKPFFKLLLDL